MNIRTERDRAAVEYISKSLLRRILARLEELRAAEPEAKRLGLAMRYVSALRDPEHRAQPGRAPLSAARRLESWRHECASGADAALFANAIDACHDHALAAEAAAEAKRQGSRLARLARLARLGRLGRLGQLRGIFRQAAAL
ncbi:MAG: hypothetical protein R3F11_10180 [Verrucomicrobiales bacterium]